MKLKFTIDDNVQKHSPKQRPITRRKQNINQYFHAYIKHVKHNEFRHFHLAGIRSRIDTTACGNAIKILHSRERRFCHNFCSRSPLAEMHILDIPPSREYDPESTVPLAGMPRIKILHPRKRDFLIISVHRPRERRCT